MTHSKFVRFFSFVPMLLLAGCAVLQPAGTVNQQPMAEDLVCKYNGDLACVMVPIAPDTVQIEYQGKTYYFCSQECRSAFQREPQKYLSVAK